ncbi:unnamed protein product [Lepeophtheirus salmonis]|uniref:(salmon louse) hypothetical protein n=1 Tax=Lepeophtheirus salmonis TaxID=72036 RepID=A0A7R8D1X5_LEPSM|nr:unnamed protein product [Lepeophtheirus salmonis]CAF2972383.1 unnamed protein product [Lepeophtheirus salmonis]
MVLYSSNESDSDEPSNCKLAVLDFNKCLSALGECPTKSVDVLSTHLPGIYDSNILEGHFEPILARIKSSGTISSRKMVHRRSNMIFQHDGSPAHTAATTEPWLKNLNQRDRIDSLLSAPRHLKELEKNSNERVEKLWRLIKI